MSNKSNGGLFSSDGRVMDDQLYTRPEVSVILSCSINFLAKDAMKETPLLPFIKLSPKFVRYRGSDIKRFMNGGK